jgi:hypothetical protein
MKELEKAKVVKTLVKHYGFRALQSGFIEKHLIVYYKLKKNVSEVISKDWQLWNHFEKAMEYMH